MTFKPRLLAVIVLVAIIVAAVTLATGIIVLPPSRNNGLITPAVVVKSTCERPQGAYLIIANLSGFNDSISHGAPMNPWPIIRVQQGQVVSIVVCNQDATQPHGFAISTYFPTGVAMAPGEAYRITFTATQTGTFVVYCNIFCTVHVFMVGQLVVQPNK